MQRRRSTIAEASRRRGVTVTAPGRRRPLADEAPADQPPCPDQGEPAPTVAGAEADANLRSDETGAISRPFAVRRTCPQCPWLRDVPVGRFPPERFQQLRRTCEQALENPVFACHKTPIGKEQACAGFLLVAGHDNIQVRLAAARGRFDIAEISATGPLFGSFAEMARANGYDPDTDMIDPAFMGPE